MSGFPHLLDQRRLIGPGGSTVAGDIYFYYSGTSVLAPIYNDPATEIPATNPISVGAGQIIPVIYLDSEIVYRRVIIYSDGTSDEEDPLGNLFTEGDMGIPLGTIMDFAGTIPPTGFLFCYGQEVSRGTYSDLFASVGILYGAGNGTTTFNLPDYRGRVGAGKDNMGGTPAGRLSSPLNGTILGGSGGEQTHLLTEAELATHNHGGITGLAGAFSFPQVVQQGFGNFSFGTSSTVGFNNLVGADHQHTIANDGSNTPHNNVQPTLILNKIIKVLPASLFSLIGLGLDTNKANADAIGISPTATNMGVFSGNVIPDFVSAKAGLESIDIFLASTSQNTDNAYLHGALGDNVNDTAALQAYQDSLPTSGGVIKLQRDSKYKLATLNITKSIRIESNGTAENCTQFVALNPVGSILNAQSAPGFWLSDVSFITSVTRSNLDPYINLSQVYRGTIQNFRMDGHSVGIRLNDASQINIKDGTLAFPLASTVLAETCGIKVGDTTYCGGLNFDNLYFTSQQVPDTYHDVYQPSYGIALYHADNISIDSCFFAYQGTSVLMRPATGQFVTNININQCTFDYSRRNILISPNGGQVSHVLVQGGLAAFSHRLGGVAIDSTNGEVSDIRLDNVDIINHPLVTGSADPLDDSPGVAVFITGPTTRLVKITNCTLTGSAVGIQVSSGENIIIDNCDFGDNGSYGPASTKGLDISVGVKGRLTNSRFKGCSVPFINSAPSTFLMDEWQDYTPVVTTGSGTITSYTATGRFRTIGNQVQVRVVINISNNGTGATDLRFTLPPIPSISGTLEGYGRSSVTGRSVQAEEVSTTVAAILDATNAYPGGVGIIRTLCSYEITTP